jgi:predicted Zn finger-like uncharacterized protein
MVIVCQHCQKKYNVDSEQLAKLPPKIRCKACKGIIELPKATVEPTGDIRTLTCSDCDKQYRVPASKLPADRDTLPCKACGGTIPLTEETDDTSVPDESDYEDQQDDSYDEAVPFYQNRWVLIGVAAVVLLVIGVSVSIKFMGGDSDTLPTQPDTNSRARESIETADASSQLDGQTNLSHSPSASSEVVTDSGASEPVAGLTVNIPLIISVVQKTIQEANDPNMAPILMGLQAAQSFGLQKAHLFVTEDSQHGFLPFICVQSANPQMLEQMIMAAPQGPAAVLESKGPGLYAYGEEIIAMLPNSIVPLEVFRLKFTEQWIMVGSEQMVTDLTDHMDTVDQYRVLQYAASLGTDQDLVRISTDVTPTMYENWQQAYQKVLDSSPGVDVNNITPQQMNRIKLAVEHLKAIKRWGLSARIAEQGERIIRYTQQFQPGVDAQAIYQALQQGDLGSTNPDDLFIQAIDQAILKNTALKRSVDLQSDQLTMEISWEQTDDQQVLASLMAIGSGLMEIE